LRLVRLLVRERPAVLQTWMYHANLLGLLAGRVVRIPVVWNVRCSNEMLAHASRRTAWTIEACARLSSWPEVVVFNSEAGWQQHAAAGYRPRLGEVVPNGFDLSRFAPDPAARGNVRTELGVGPDALLVGLVGRFDPMKGHDTFLAAAKALHTRRPEAHFVLAGHGVEPGNPALTDAVDAHPVAGKVHLLGERSDIPRLTAALDVAVSSSHFGEGFANVIGEAMACGVPCVVTDVGDSAAVVGRLALVVPPRDPVALAGAWEQLIAAGPETRRVLGLAARERVRHKYALEHVVGVYERLYESLAGASRT
jgi:glycosyltransferase involved in cell wall biosynthesis